MNEGKIKKNLESQILLNSILKMKSNIERKK